MKFIDTHHDVWRNVGGDDGPMVTITPKPNLLLSLIDCTRCASTGPPRCRSV